MREISTGFSMCRKKNRQGSLNRNKKSLAVRWRWHLRIVTEEIRQRLLPFGSIDETVRGDGSYLIFYDPEAGTGPRGVVFGSLSVLCTRISEARHFWRRRLMPENGSGLRELTPNYKDQKLPDRILRIRKSGSPGTAGGGIRGADSETGE